MRRSRAKSSIAAFVCALALVPALTQTVAGSRFVPYGLDVYMPVPEDNAITPAKVALGRRLFFDRRLSKDGSMSCATCHDPARAFTNGRSIAVGIAGARGERNVPTLVNRGYGRSFFLDGRAPSLEAQVVEPIGNPRELGSSVARVVERLSTDVEYRAAFLTTFNMPVNGADLARALATYVRTIASGRSPFDLAINGDRKALSSSQRRGLELFLGKGNCWLCHKGPTLSDEQFHNTGVAYRSGSLKDEGRARVTRAPEDRGAFKTPTLREIARTAPYMHDGGFATLGEVIAYYDRGGAPNPGLDAKIRPLHLSAVEKKDLLALLGAFTGTVTEGR